MDLDTVLTALHDGLYALNVRALHAHVPDATVREESAKLLTRIFTARGLDAGQLPRLQRCVWQAYLDAISRN
jgi:hypothetical protein